MPQFLVIFFTFVTNALTSWGIAQPSNTQTYSAPIPDPIEAQVSQMSLKEKIRQTLVCSFPDQSLESALKVQESCGNIFYSKTNLKGVNEQTIQNSNRLLHEKDPLTWIMVDQEGGRVARIWDGSPSPRKMQEENTVGYWGDQHGKILKELDFNVDLAPVADITQNSPVIEDRSFADDPIVDGQAASTYLKALQSHGIVGVLKHLPGHGRVDTDTHKQKGTLNYSWEEIKSFDLIPFIDTINNGARIVMIGHISIPELDTKPASISPIIIDKLRTALPSSQDLIFLTDSLSMEGVGLPQEDAAIAALKAGVDMILIQDTSESGILTKLISAYETGDLDESKLNQSVTRILQIKTANP